MSLYSTFTYFIRLEHPKKASGKFKMSTDSGLCLMEAMGTPLQNAVDGIELLAEGKVREIYDIGYDYLVLHATDRISGEHSVKAT